jgi:hypothetical protein
MLANRILNGTAVLSMGVALSAFLFVPSAQAIPGKGKAAAAGKAQEKGVVQELKSAKALLEKADHDYQGHRARAVHEIHEALKALGHHHQAGAAAQKSGTGGKAGAAKKGAGAANVGAGKGGGKKGTAGFAKAGNAGGGKGGNEQQVVSDAQLKQALHQLTMAHAQLRSSRAVHHAMAAQKVQAAIGELHTALKIK